MARKLTHYIVALTDNPYGSYNMAPVHVHAENREQAVQEGLQEIIENADLTPDELVGYDVGVTLNSNVTYYQIDTAPYFQLSKRGE